MSKQYKYDAFISYRHTDLDKFVAEKIHRYLESFKLPKNVTSKKDVKKTRIERVFRDKEELTITNNLEDPIVQALRESEYLIVICSPRTKESVWCRTEIEKFIEFHGRNRILTVLIEGEPQDSFPEELLYEEEVVKENGVESIYRRDVEPLAADVRANSRSKMCKLIKSELLRVIAPMFGLEYDDLRQRHRERRMKKIMTATVAAAGLGVVIGAAGVASALIISNQKDEIQKQNNEITSQKEQIENQNHKLLLQQVENLNKEAIDSLENDRRIDAINTALSSVTEYEGMKMPYTSGGRYALTQSLRVYDIGDVSRAQNQYVAQTNITDVELSQSGKYVLAFDKSKTAYVWDVSTGNLVVQIDDLSSDVYFDSDICFVGDQMLAYYNCDKKVVVRSFENNEDKVIYEAKDFRSIKGDASGKYIAIRDDKDVVVYDVAEGDETQINAVEVELDINTGYAVAIKRISCNSKVEENKENEN